MPRRNKPAMVNGEMVTTIYLTVDDVCEYCGEPRCRWQNHSEARADVAAWRRELRAQEFPFGDHREGYPNDDQD